MAEISLPFAKFPGLQSLIRQKTITGNRIANGWFADFGKKPLQRVPAGKHPKPTDGLPENAHALR